MPQRGNHAIKLTQSMRFFEKQHMCALSGVVVFSQEQRKPSSTHKKGEGFVKRAQIQLAVIDDSIGQLSHWTSQRKTTLLKHVVRAQAHEGQSISCR